MLVVDYSQRNYRVEEIWDQDVLQHAAVQYHLLQLYQYR